MTKYIYLIVLVYVHTALAIWTCTYDTDCTELEGSICDSGTCVCPIGKQSVLNGALCAEIAPYHTSSCFDNLQCSRLFTSFECRQDSGTNVGSCACQAGSHYFLGRCWTSVDYGESCTRNEECLGVIRDVYSLSCDNTCRCAEGYYERQRGECRKIGYEVGDGCVLNEDCQFTDGACDISTFTCYNINADASQLNKVEVKKNVSKYKKEAAADTSSELGTSNEFELRGQYGEACDIFTPCDELFACTGTFGVCVCPLGYYMNQNGDSCLAELGSPASDSSQCVGLLAEIRDGICTCPPNFYFAENMRDCIKVARFITDACVSDYSCHTFGSASRCGPPQEPWGLRNCECIEELAVWDANRNMCRLFAGIGEVCEVDSDCLAGELEIQCQIDDSGQGYCACPEGLTAVDGLCLTTGLELGDACQVTAECTETPNTVCTDGRCSCDENYSELDGNCAPAIGGLCEEDSDCIITDTVCTNSSDVLSCQCIDSYVDFNEECWPVVDDFEGFCNVTRQCTTSFGENSECRDEHCVCSDRHHFRDGRCWPETGLFEQCSRSSECYLRDGSERVVCRNSLCQCDYTYPYLEDQHTCESSAATVMGSLVLIFSTIFYLSF